MRVPDFAFARFNLMRETDVSGVSGTGVVACGVQFPDGTVSIRWLTDKRSTVIWDSLSDAMAVHGHNGATTVQWLDEVVQVYFDGKVVGQAIVPSDIEDAFRDSAGNSGFDRPLPKFVDDALAEIEPDLEDHIREDLRVDAEPRYVLVYPNGQRVRLDGDLRTELDVRFGKDSYVFTEQPQISGGAKAWLSDSTTGEQLGRVEREHVSTQQGGAG